MSLPTSPTRNDVLALFEGTPFRVGVGGYDTVLLGEARRAGVRALRASKRHNSTLEAGASAAAVLCSAAACEARVSEYLAHYEFAHGTLPPDLEQIRKVWDALEQWRLLLKYNAPTFDSGTSSEYRALGCLLRLRDLIAHRHARLAPLDTLPDRIEDCVRQRVIPVPKASGVDWTSIMFVHAVAQWACRAARDWLRVADALMPLHC